MSTDQPRDPAVKHVSAHFYIDAPLHEGLKAIKERDGVSEAEQMRRGIKLYLESKGLCLPKTSSPHYVHWALLRISRRPASITGHADRLSRTVHRVGLRPAEPGGAPD